MFSFIFQIVCGNRCADLESMFCKNFAQNIFSSV